MSGFEGQLERLELKYLIHELTAARICRQIQAYCRPDEHNPPSGGCREERGYSISSLYLDSPSLAFHRAKERGDPDRLKLRVRTYEASLFAMLEIKRKSSDVVAKTRVSVDRSAVEQAVGGLEKPRIDGRDYRRRLDHFAFTAAHAGAEPSLHVRYRREAYVSSVDDYARVTFDRSIQAQRASGWDLEPDPDGWSDFDERWGAEFRATPVVLELKCHTRVPIWISDLIRSISLERRSFSKYSIGIHLTGLRAGSIASPRRSARVMM